MQNIGASFCFAAAVVKKSLQERALRRLESTEVDVLRLCYPAQRVCVCFVGAAVRLLLLYVKCALTIIIISSSHHYYSIVDTLHLCRYALNRLIIT